VRLVLQRHFSALGWDCDVVAPWSIPRPSGERIKTDRRKRWLPSRSPSGSGYHTLYQPAEDRVRPIDREKPYQRLR
jgi:transposase